MLRILIAPAGHQAALAGRRIDQPGRLPGAESAPATSADARLTIQRRRALPQGRLPELMRLPGAAKRIPHVRQVRPVCIRGRVVRITSRAFV